MGIVDEDIARVRAATDFVAVAGEHLALRRVGTRWVGLCPFHTEKSASFSLNAELGFYYCFGCGATTTRRPAVILSAGPAFTKTSRRPSPGITNDCSPRLTPPRPGRTCGAN